MGLFKLTYLTLIFVFQKRLIEDGNMFNYINKNSKIWIFVLNR